LRRRPRKKDIQPVCEKSAILSIKPTTSAPEATAHTPTYGIKAATGTVYALPVTISNNVFAAQQSSEKSTTSTTYTSLVWDTNADGSPEVKASKTEPITFLVRGNGAYNQVLFIPRLYYDKNPVTPKDFGFTELYLMRLRADATNTLVRVNDRTNIYFAGSGDTVAIDPNFRAPVKKLQVITGRATADPPRGALTWSGL
jgi:hypothetical protein